MERTSRTKLLSRILLAAMLAGLAQINAQSPEATITGTVTDPQGAPIPNAAIVARQVTTQFTFRTRTGQDGIYVLPALPVGDYEVTVTADGFKKFTEQGITLQVDQRLRLDAAMQIGSAQETLQVTAEVPRVQTEDSTLGTVVETRRVQELPLNGRQPFLLINLVPGVQISTTTANGFADSANQDVSRVRMNGGSILGNQFFLDGAMDTVPAINEMSVVPMVDSIAEFRVETNGLKAEFGQTSGGVVNLVTKSGTNALHGSGYEFLRNDAFNARNAFATTVPLLRYNQYGGTLGGPVRLPKVYNGRDRTFFFFGYEQWHSKGSTVQRSTVPTALQRSGDFSQTFDGTGKLIPIYDPATTMVNPNGNGYVRSAFAGNIVPASRIDPLAAKVLTYMPLPDIAPTVPLTNANNYYSQQPSPVDEDTIDVRIDHRISDSDTVWFRYAGTLNFTQNEGWGLGPSDPAARFDHRYNHNAAIGETHIFSPFLLNEFRAAVTRQYLTYAAPSVGGNWPQQLGFPGIIPRTEFPAVLISGDLGIGFSTSGSPSEGDRAQFTMQFADSVTWVKGRHTIKFGVDQRITRLNYLSQTFPSGEFTFSGSLTDNPQVPAGTGIPMADYLLGQVGGGQQTINPAFAYKTWSLGTYVQDDFKLTSRFTVNLGLRYDISGPPTERYNRYSNFNPSLNNPQTNLPGALVYAGVTAPSTFVNYDYNNFGPRFGFAYSLGSNNRTVVRGGFGIVYNPAESGDIHGNASNAVGFSNTTTFSANGPFPAFQFSQGPAVLLQPLGAAGGPAAFLGQSVNFQDPHAPVPYAEQWNLTVQRELPGAWVASLGYVGNHGVKLFGGNYNLDQINPAYYASYGTRLQNQVPNPFYGLITTGSLSAATISQAQALLPYPDYLSVTTLANHGADSIYHSLQATVEHRYAKGITALFSYTFGKLLSDSGGSNDSGESVSGTFRIGAYNRALDRTVDPTDISQRAVFSGSWEMPFGQLTHGPVRQLVQGWQLNAIITLQSGFPLAVTGANNFTIGYPNILFNPTLPASQRSVSHWFNTSAFANPPNYVIGDIATILPYLRGPGLANADLSVSRNFRLHESVVLQFRAEAFNALNRVNYGNPNTSFSPNAQGVNTNSLFGQITSALAARALQLALHLSW